MEMNRRQTEEIKALSAAGREGTEDAQKKRNDENEEIKE